MRTCLALVTLAAAAPAPAQPAAAPPSLAVRYGVGVDPISYPQGTPADAVASTAKAIDRAQFEYLAAHLIDPAFVDGLVAGRVARLLDPVDRELRVRRDGQRGDPAAVENRLPVDPVGFAEVVQAEAQARAFRQVVGVVRGHLEARPRTARDLRILARDSAAAVAGDAATFAPVGTARQVRLVRRVDGPVSRPVGRWFVEDRQTPPPPAAEPGR